MSATLELIRDEVAGLKLDDSLLFLNRLLGAGRGDAPDPPFRAVLRARTAGAPAFVVHFLAKQLLLHASNLGLRRLDGPRFVRLMDLYFQIDDPIGTDPDWPTADPSGFFERMLGQQVPSQHRNMLQKLGLALGLFRDVGVVRTPEPYDIRADLELELGLPVERFIGAGLACSAFRGVSRNGYKYQATFDHEFLDAAHRQGVTCCAPDVRDRFLGRAACDRDAFRAACRHPQFEARDALYVPFEFNPLARFPLTDVGAGHFVAVDPDLVTDRVTLGLFYDLFERGRTEFSRRFGPVFDKFVGDLLGSVYPPGTLWWEADPGRTRPKNAGKVADWAYRGRTHTVLVECKSLRPSLELLTYGSEGSVREVANRVAGAVRQLSGHADAIRAGRWAAHGFGPGPVVGLVVTYGRIRTVNGPFTRRRVARDLADAGVEAIPHVVLSLEELDHVVRLVELGTPFDEVIAALAAAEDSFNPLLRYGEVFGGGRAISKFVYRKAEAFWESLTSSGPRQNRTATTSP